MPRSGALFAVVLIAVYSLLNAAAISVKSGTVEAVSADGSTVTVKFNRADHATEVKIAPKAEILLDNKSIDVDSLKPGMSVTVQIGDDGAERIFARTAKDKPASSTAASKPTKSKPVIPTRKLPKSTSKATAKAPAKGKGGTSSGGRGALPALQQSPFDAMKSPTPKPRTAATPVAASWPSFLGPKRDNISKETGLLRSWPADGPELVWHTPGLGQGYSNVAIADGIVFSMGTPANQESVLAIDLDSGKPLWSVPTGGPVFQETHGNGPRGTPTIDAGFAYALGATGDLVCVDIKSKSLVWHKNIAQEFGSSGLMYGYSESVLIDGSKLICTPGGQAATIVALDKKTGDVLWQRLIPVSPQAAYSSPIATDAGGIRQYINFLARGVVGVKAADGELLWANDAAANQNAICTTPLLIGDNVFTSSWYGGGSALIRLAASNSGMQANLVYHTREMSNHHGGLVAMGGFVYGADGDILKCISLEQRGRTVWFNRSIGKCSLTCADGHLYVRGENGLMALVEATPDEYRESGRFAPPRNSLGRPAWTYPVVAGGRLFLRDQDDLLCYSLRASK